ncbi:MAG: DUF1391 family protein [Deltaproteobacteria bacterium]|nr:DUF1391 family protein [Deltaproteobacteria bacterium]
MENIKTKTDANNESISRGWYQNTDKTFTALTYAESKDFKTQKGAEKWLAKRGIK